MAKGKPQSQVNASRAGSWPRSTLGSRAEKAAPKPWHRTTIAVSLVSLAGALLALTLSQVVAEHVRMYGGLSFYLNALGLGSGAGGADSYDGRDAFGPLGLGPDGGNSAEAEKAAFDAADSFALGNTEYSSGRFEAARQHYEDAVRFAPLHSFAWANLGNVQVRESE
jgi:tetratricopeptide (TPR) repeat protein